MRTKLKQRTKLLTLAIGLCVSFIWLGRNEVCGQGLQRYYGQYYLTPTGESRIRLTFNSNGPAGPRSKWRAECNDGEGLIAVRDIADDYEDLNEMKCRFLFPYKPPTKGIYPFYEGCRALNVTNGRFHCFDPIVNNNTVNSFIVGIWDDDASFRIGLAITSKSDYGHKIKCCQMPSGYYVDYTGCHYRYTHDQFYMYYDMFFYAVQCPDRYAMTGYGTLAPPTDLNVHLDWIQCCPYVFQPENLAAGFEVGSAVDYTAEYLKKYNPRDAAKLNQRFNTDALKTTDRARVEQTKQMTLDSYSDI